MSKVTAGSTIVRFDQMATLINDRVDNPAESGVERYVGLEHLDADSLRIRRWGDITDVESTKLRFQPGDIIFGKRRVYQRKLAVADFEGICSAHAMVLRAKANVVLSEFLPFFMQSDRFMERALAISVGSLSPTINWTTLAAEEFALPPMEEQGRIVASLDAFSKGVNALHSAAKAAMTLRDCIEDEMCAQVQQRHTQTPLDECLSNVMDFRGRTPKKLGMGWGGDIPALSAMNVLMDRIDLSKDTKCGTRSLYDRWMTQGDLEVGDLLFTTEAPLGNVCMLDQNGPFILSQRVVALRVNRNRVIPEFLNAVMRTSSFRRELDRRSTGTTAKGIRVASLVEIPIRVPPLEVQEQAAQSILDTKAALDRLEVRYHGLREMMACHLNASISPKGEYT